MPCEPGTTVAGIVTPPIVTVVVSSKLGNAHVSQSPPMMRSVLFPFVVSSGEQCSATETASGSIPGASGQKSRKDGWFTP